MSAVTPRKRKVSNSAQETRTTRSRSKNVPAPNPPLVPFPTPPSTRHRTDKKADLHFQSPTRQPDFSLDASASQSSSSGPSKAEQSAVQLPPHLQTLLSLHHAFNLALSLHIATRPPVLPPHSPSTTLLDLPNLTNFIALKDTVERTSGRRFGLPELGRLAWLWCWDGKEVQGSKLVSEKNKSVDEEENPFLVRAPEGGSAPGPSTSSVKVSGLSYILTPTRTLDSGGRRVHTHGIGIQLDLKAGETRQLLLNGKEGGSGNQGQGGGMAAVGRWNSGQEHREDIVRERLERWVELHGGYQPPPPVAPTAYPTPTSSDSARSTIPPIPILPLPHLGQATLLPSANLFSSPSKLDSSPGLSTPPKKPALADPFVLDDGKEKPQVVRTGSVEERRQAMMDRIKARSGKTSTLGSSVGPDALNQIRPKVSAVEQQEALKRRSTLSRLESVAEGVWMMFSAPSPGPSSLPTPPRGRRKAIPMSEVADVIVKSSKTPISSAEAHTSLKMLADLCPLFLTVKTVAKKEWLEMPPAVAMPPSPGAAASSSRLMSALDFSPTPRSRNVSSSGGLLGTPESPSSKGTLAQAPLLEPPSSPTPGARKLPTPGATLSPGAALHTIQASPTRTPVNRTPTLAGPASPGRVRRVYGLREVRERIRRELGE